jgi:hypothetical protein
MDRVPGADVGDSVVLVGCLYFEGGAVRLAADTTAAVISLAVPVDSRCCLPSSLFDD